MDNFIAHILVVDEYNAELESVRELFLVGNKI